MLVAPDSFKGTLSAAEVAHALGEGLREAGMPADLCPVADGGEGTLDALCEAFDCELHTESVSDPLGRPVQASFGLGTRRDGRPVAVLECAAASGLGLVAREERDAVAASTYGTGELIAHARRAGAELIYLGVGGSATTDGGDGAIQAIGEAGGLDGAQITVLCDVRTTFVGAATVFGPQKGADERTVALLVHRLEEMAARLPRDPRAVPMTGAAGGLSGGLWAMFGAELVPGAAFVLDAVRFDQRLRDARAVVTGEGKLDQQSLAGKLIAEIATRARQSGVPCHAVVGRRELDAFGARVLDLQLIIEAGTVDELRAAGRRLAELTGVHESPGGR
jgi:glycerate kinase